MRSRANVGLLIVAIAGSSLAYAHAPGVTHTYERGEPVITVRLVPDEAAVSKAPRVDALAPPAAAHTDPAAQPAEGEFNAPLTPEPAVTEPAIPEPGIEESAADQGAAISRYPTARPKMKPNTETGVGGVLDLTPPATEETGQPKPMRLNSVDRPRRVVERAPRQKPREERRVTRRAPVEVAPVAPSLPDPMDAALPPRVIESESDLLPPVTAMQLPPVKAEDRIADGN